MQIEQDFALCTVKFPNLICHPIAAQFMDDDLIALFQFEQNQGQVRIITEKHYRLVPAEDVSSADLESYQNRPLAE